MTALFVNNTEDGRLHHFILGFEPFQNKNENTADERTRLNRYYEQLKQSIVENENYAEALLQTANAVYTVDLTNESWRMFIIMRQHLRLKMIYRHHVLIAIIAINGVGM